MSCIYLNISFVYGIDDNSFIFLCCYALISILFFILLLLLLLLFIRIICIFIFVYWIIRIFSEFGSYIGCHCALIGCVELMLLVIAVCFMSIALYVYHYYRIYFEKRNSIILYGCVLCNCSCVCILSFFSLVCHSVCMCVCAYVYFSVFVNYFLWSNLFENLFDRKSKLVVVYFNYYLDYLNTIVTDIWSRMV